MARTEKSFFKRLTTLFRSGPVVKRKLRSLDTTIAAADRTRSSGVLLFQKSIAPTYATITANAYNLSERLMRYQDFQEMELTPEIASAMDIYADESVAQDDKGRILHVYSDNEKIREVLDELFYNVLNIDFNLRSWIRNLVKYGDFFMYIDVHPEHGVVHTFPIPVNEIEREENFDRKDPFAVRFRWVTLGNRVLENWEVAHLRLLGNDMFLPYGSSMIEPARRIWRQLILIEDAMLVYRVVRAPERRVFYIDVANIPPEEVANYVEKQKTNLRSQQVIDKSTSRVDLRYNPLSVDEDFFIPVRGGESGTKIDTLAAGANTGTVEDVAYIQKKLFAALKVPSAYLGYEEMLSSKATLAQMDIRFSRTINVIQKTVVSELQKIAIIHLYAKGFTDDDLIDFTLRLSNPSTIAEQQKLELWRARFEIAGSVPEGMSSKRFLYRRIWGLTDKEIRDIDEERLAERIIDSRIEGAAEGGADVGGGSASGFGDSGGGAGGGGGGDDLGGDAGGGGGGGDLDLGDVGGDDAAAEEPDAGDDELPDEENAGEEPTEEEEDELDLLLAGDDAEGEAVPIAVSPLTHAGYNRGRRRHHGPSKTHMPDFAKMVGPGKPSDSMLDPYDNTWMKTIVSPDHMKGLTKPIKFEHLDREDERVRPTLSGIPVDTLAALMKMGEHFGWGQAPAPTDDLLQEGNSDDVFDDEVDIGGEPDGP